MSICVPGIPYGKIRETGEKLTLIFLPDMIELQYILTTNAALQSRVYSAINEVVMETVKDLFLQALGASLQNKTVDWEGDYTASQWCALFDMAASQNVLPMIFDAVVRSPAAQKADPQLLTAVKRQVRQVVMLQTIKTDAFLKLMRELTAAGVTPLVVKGILCRELYPNPDYRMSADEDLLIPEDQFSLCHHTLLSCGLEMKNPDQDPGDFEISYIQQGNGLHIELHKQLFPPASEAYGELNRFFEDVHLRSVTQNVQNVPVPTVHPTDHLFYLICHSFKHFLHSGFGIRQVCDICLYANAFGFRIDWNQIVRQCEEIRADIFAAALFRIGERYLNFRPEAACYPDQWRNLEVDEGAMLEELLDSGVFGGSSMSRKHSSNMTLQAVADRKQGKKGGNGIWKTLFPSAENLSGRYPYLKDKPYLLPVAWTDRIVKYRRETAAGGIGNNAAESIRIGNERIGLLKQYGIIDR